MVLLENDGVLPLKGGEKVAIFGRGQINFVSGGYGAAAVKVSNPVNLLDDWKGVQGDYYLRDDELDMITKVNARFEDVVVVMNTGNVMDMTWIEGFSHISAVLLAWQPGIEGGTRQRTFCAEM